MQNVDEQFEQEGELSDFVKVLDHIGSSFEEVAESVKELSLITEKIN